MADARLLLLYATREGQTEKIAERIAELLRARGHVVELRDAAHLPRGFLFAGFDGVILGAPVHYGRHAPELGAFVTSHRDELREIPSALFSVSLVAASASPDERREAQEYVEELQRRTGWRPGLVGLFPGALRYSRYRLPTRLVMRWISRRRGKPTDTSRDYEYTRWDSVERFAEAFLERLPRAAERPPPALIDEGPPAGAAAASPPA